MDGRKLNGVFFICPPFQNHALRLHVCLSAWPPGVPGVHKSAGRRGGQGQESVRGMLPAGGSGRFRQGRRGRRRRAGPERQEPATGQVRGRDSGGHPGGLALLTPCLSDCFFSCFLFFCGSRCEKTFLSLERPYMVPSVPVTAFRATVGRTIRWYLIGRRYVRFWGPYRYHRHFVQAPNPHPSFPLSRHWQLMQRLTRVSGSWPEQWRKRRQW